MFSGFRACLIVARVWAAASAGRPASFFRSSLRFGPFFGPGLACLHGDGLGGLRGSRAQSSRGPVVGERDLLLAQAAGYVLGADLVPGIDAPAGAPSAPLGGRRPVQEQVQGGQVWQDAVLADVGVPRPFGVRRGGGGGVAVDLARMLEFMLLDRKDEWLAARLEDLDYGHIDGIAAATRQYPLVGTKKDEIDTALGYFENNAPRMRYHWFRQCGLFVGADAIIALRCREASSHREAVCNTPDSQTLTA